MTTHTLTSPVEETGLHRLVPGDERLTADQVARRTGVPLDIAYVALRIAIDAGYIDRDEFGTYAAWCAWPRAGL